MVRLFLKLLTVVSSIIVTPLLNITCILYFFYVMFNLDIGTWDNVFRFEDDFPDWSTGFDSW